MITNYSLKIIKARCSLKLFILLCLALSLQSSLNAQKSKFDTIAEAFQEYSEPYREVVYAHLNKTTLIKGEMLGFSGYVIKKNKKTLSKISKNLYCVITDSSNRLIKSKLVNVEGGFANNTFNIDSSFTTGHYTFKAYTNWMKNFDEPNAFAETFMVIDPQTQKIIKNKIIKNKIDVQFLPEGGHFIDMVEANVGVIAKNTLGYGVPNIEGIVYNAKNEILTNFKTNALGIGSFFLKPELSEDYKVEIKHLNKAFTYKINGTKPQGIAINVKRINDYLAIEFNTNAKTLSSIKNRPFKLTIHNGKSIKVIAIDFDKTSILKRINVKNLFSGINIITLFNEHNMPVLERLYFNYDGINLAELEAPIIQNLNDSIQVTIPFKALSSSSKENHISVSVLPKNTKSYESHHNIISYTYLQPYLKGYIENAAYYFKAITDKKKYDLDKLLITQGWSSYDWNSIFNNKAINSFVFEDGIAVNANNNNPKDKSFIIYPNERNTGFVINLSKDEKSFKTDGFYPYEKDQLKIGALRAKGRSETPNLYIQFEPTRIPDFNYNLKTLKPKETSYTQLMPVEPFTVSYSKATQQLNEVTIKVENNRSLKVEKLIGSSFYNVDFIGEESPYRNLRFIDYLNSIGFLANEQRGDIVFTRRPRNTDQDPVFYLDNFRLNNTIPLVNLFMNKVDFVAVNLSGFGSGLLDGTAAVIKIFTNKDYKSNFKTPFRGYEFPLAFSKEKKFYAPIYESYNNEFFESFGVIKWIPNCKRDENGNLVFNILHTGGDLSLFIEGIVGDGNFLSTSKTISANN